MYFNFRLKYIRSRFRCGSVKLAIKSFQWKQIYFINKQRFSNSLHQRTKKHFQQSATTAILRWVAAACTCIKITASCIKYRLISQHIHIIHERGCGSLNTTLWSAGWVSMVYTFNCMAYHPQPIYVNYTYKCENHNAYKLFSGTWYHVV